jgi:alkaline phosphatase D
MRKSIVLCVLIIGLAGFATAETSEEVFPYSVASGDPRPNSVVLWTYLASPLDIAPLIVTLEVATDDAFADVVYIRQIEVNEMYGGAVKVLVDGLEPYMTYYYQFTHGEWMSRIGRTRTAPTPDMDVDPKFAVVYCQDWVGRYYNSYMKLLRDYDDDIDFVVHLGDYIYETTGDPRFQETGSDRAIEFEDTEGAIMLGQPPNHFYAAASLSNYRELYRHYRSDPVFQQVHERWPMMVIWDDHEYSDDAWGATATYSNGRVDEYDPIRKQNAEQAFFEWVPIEVGLGDDGTLEIDASILYPNTMIYRDFPYGTNLHLALGDSRTYRPDHLVPEDAYPGAIAVDRQGLIDLLGDFDYDAIKGDFDPYIDMDVLALFLPILKQTTTMIASQGYLMENPALGQAGSIKTAEAAVSGLQSATIINSLYQQAGFPAPFNNAALAMMPRGVPFWMIGKSGLYSSGGSRNQVLHDTFSLYAAHRYLTTAGAAQEVYGAVQTGWLQATLLTSPATWKILGQTVMMTPLVIDFTNPFIAAFLPPGFPDILRTRFGVIVEDFNGFPFKRLEMIGLMGAVPNGNGIVISGDIHGAFVTDHNQGVFEFTPPAISSSTINEEVLRRIRSDPILGSIPGIEEIVGFLGFLFQISSLDDINVSPSDIKYTKTDSHGFAIMQAGSEALDVVFYQVPETSTLESYYDDPEALDALVTVMPFRVQDGELTIGGPPPVCCSPQN